MEVSPRREIEMPHMRVSSIDDDSNPLYGSRYETNRIDGRYSTSQPTGRSFAHRLFTKNKGIKLMLLLATLVFLFRVSLNPTKDEALNFKLDKIVSLTPLKPEKTYFYLLPHSHNDASWLETEKEIYDKYVKKILLTSMSYLSKTQKPAAHFTYCEVGLIMHYLKVNPSHASFMRKLIADGQLEIVNGGIAMHDSATAYYDDILTNFEEGKTYAKEVLNTSPRVGWMIDPFGIGLSTLRIYSKLGYEEIVFTRASDDDKREWEADNSLQFLWKMQESSPNTRPVFTHLFKQRYGTPDPFFIEFPWAFSRKKIPNTTILSHLFNLDEKIEEFFGNLISLSRGYPTNQILIPMGSDFTYTNFAFSYSLIDMIMIFWKCNNLTGRYKSDINLEVTSVKNYFEKVREAQVAQKADISVKKGDFLPLIEGYKDSPRHASWTGYFTTKPFTKKCIKSHGQLVRGIRSIASLIDARGINVSLNAILDSTKNSMWLIGMHSHHDAITGTAKSYVTEDYLKLIDEDVKRINNYTWPVFSSFLAANGKSHDAPTNFRLVSPFSETARADSGGQYIFLSTGGVERRLIRLFNKVENIVVNDTQTAKVQKVWSTCVNAYLKKSELICEHIFIDHPRGGEGKLYNIEFLKNVKKSKEVKPQQLSEGKFQSVSIKNRAASVSIGLDKCKLVFFEDKEDSGIELGLFEYKSNRRSTISNFPQGKYMFQSADGGTPVSCDSSQASWEYSAEGDAIVMRLPYLNNLWILEVKYMPGAPETQRLSVRFYGENLDKGGDRNTNYVIRYFSKLKNKDEFYTDTNGIDSIKRIRGKNGPVMDKNYYPITKFAYIEDDSSRFSVIVDRTEGCTSPAEGVLEVMIARRSNQDDQRGAVELEVETHPVIILHYIVRENLKLQTEVYHQELSKDHARLYRSLQIVEDCPPIIAYLGAVKNGYKLIEGKLDFEKRNFGVQNSHLRVTFDSRPVIGDPKGSSLIARFHNMHDTQQLEFSPENILRRDYNLNVESIEEISLDTTQTAAEISSQNYKWSHL